MLRLWLLAVAVPTMALASVFKDVDHDHWTHRYDRLFRKYAKHYFGPTLDWRWFKAQGIAESGLDPKARSHRGAVGIMQILPSTFKFLRKKNPALGDIATPRWNIAAGIYYDRYLYNKWDDEPVRGLDRLFLAFSAYNAGHMRVRRAYNRAVQQLGQVRHWEQLKPFLPGQTRHYVARIRKLMKQAL